jgi:penicillin-binding protein 1C
VLVIDVETGHVKAYAGNIPGKPVEMKGYNVDVIQAERSTGSILKPMLFSMVIDEGKALQESLIEDIPTIIGGYAPKNYYSSFDGAVPLKQAIARSLNVPAVRLLHDYGIEKFHYNLKKFGLTTLHYPATHYGLTIILGGAEAKLWDIAQVYRNFAWKLNHYHLNYKKQEKQILPVCWSKEQIRKPIPASDYPSPAALWLTLEAMNEVSRPEEDQNWRSYASSFKVAWKTGTSFGNRDGWAVGCTADKVVAVWVGNASGEGRPGLTGIEAAAPIMFDIFRLFKNQHWFLQPFNDMKKIKVCKQSGFQPSEYCQEFDTVWVAKAGINTPACPYHKYVFLDKTGTWRVSSECENIANMQRKSWFVLPPSVEHYYKMKNPAYRSLPPYRNDCRTFAESSSSFSLIYPSRNTKVYIPIELDGSPGKVVFEAASRNPDSRLYWYLDDYFLGKTEHFHQLGLNPQPGKHILTLVSEEGERKQVTIEVVGNQSSQGK